VKKFLLIACAMTALATPSVSSEPQPGFADQVVMACMHVGVIDVTFDDKGALSRYRHTNSAPKSVVEHCLTTAYTQTMRTMYPNHQHSASKITVLRSGHIKLSY
jgi:hypothetical protein